jgi:hypothetical protein
MKKIRYIFVLSLIFFIVSCEKDNDFETYDLGSEFFISNNGLTSLDTDVIFSIENQSKNLTEVIMYKGSDELGTIAITDGVGSITLSSSNLGLTEAGSSASFRFDAVFDGKPFSRSNSLTVGDPMHLTSPYIWSENEDGDMERTSVTVYQNDDVQYIMYEVSPKRATVGSMMVETKVGVDGVYTEVTGSFMPEMDSLPVVGANYSINDTVYYQFTAKSGDRQQVDELNFVVNKYEFANIGGANLVPNEAFDLVYNDVVLAGTAEADLEVVHVVLQSIGFQSNNGALYVAVDESVYANNDIVEAKALFDAGSQQSGFAGVEVGDVFVYKTMRDGTAHYGIIKIKAAYLTQNGEGDYLEFEYRY